MANVVLGLGVAAGLPLLTLLICTWTGVSERIWPTPGPGSWQSRVFWTLFRTLNVTAFAAAAIGSPGALGLPEAIRGAGLGLLLAAGTLYLYALWALGHANTYCNREGLVTHGIYRWTRNPQYATVIPAYLGLMLFADDGPTTLICLVLTGVYLLMALNEEPWLASAYGDEYRRYCSRVPRFFNWGRAMVLAQTMLRQWGRHVAVRFGEHARPWQATGNGGRKRL